MSSSDGTFPTDTDFGSLSVVSGSSPSLDSSSSDEFAGTAACGSGGFSSCNTETCASTVPLKQLGKQLTEAGVFSGSSGGDGSAELDSTILFSSV